MRKSTIFRSMVIVFTLVLFASCEPPATSNSGITVTDYTTSGDLVLSGQLSVQNGKINLTLG